MSDAFEFEMEEVPEVSDHSLWVERYRPRKSEDFIGSDVVKETMKLWFEKKDIPHLMFYSCPGTGKTSLAKMIVKNIPCDSLLINASDENGIDDIRNKVQNFAMNMGMRDLKIMVLDEADRLTPEAQSMMRSLMESYSHSTRFILTCNHQERISPAIKSRCQCFEIKPPSKPDVAKHLLKILKEEKINNKMEDIAFVVNSYFPDMRKIINFSQQSSLSGELKIAKENAIDNDYRQKLLELLKTAGTPGTFDKIRQLVADASFSNYEEVYKFLFDKVNDFAGNKAPEIILTLADAVYQSAIVFEREITFVAAMHRILTVLNKK